MAKGAGMIHPQMATMLAFLTTDAPIARRVLGDLLRDAVERTFNQVTVDGDTSTNDAVIVLASGAAGGEPIEDGADRDAFAERAGDRLPRAGDRDRRRRRGRASTSSRCASPARRTTTRRGPSRARLPPPRW